MNKPSRIAKKTVELQRAQRPSIRREPPPADNAVTRKLARIDWTSREWEVRLAIGGIVFFAVAIAALVIDLGEFASWN
jgi:hypothetical protein